MLLWSVVLLVLLPGLSSPARILAMYPLPAKSHHILVNAMVRTLASRGHQVVLYTPYPWERPLDNVTVVHLDNIVSMDLSITKEVLESYMCYSPIGLTTPLLQTSGGLVENVYNSQKVHDLINSRQHFDLVLLETFYSQEPFLALGKKFNAPVIAMHPFGAYGIVNQVMGNPLNLAFIPDFGSPVSDRMSFLERLINAYSILKPMSYFYSEHLPEKNALMRRLFNDSTLPPVEELLQDISLVFNNAHATVHYTQPYDPNVIPIGGIHLQSHVKPLPPAMHEFLEEATDGVIYFSLGSITPDEKLGDEFFAKFLNVFRTLPQRVLWKSNVILQELPSNVMITKWAPQQDVLAHRNVRVFITHGGLFSQHEAIHAGVPVVCMPMMCDQPMNAMFYEEKQIGVRLLYDTLSEETIRRALATVINDARYKDNMARMSRIYRDRQVSPADSLVFWAEYVIRHGGGSHLRPAASTLSFYNLYLLDIVVAVLAVLSFTTLAIYLFLKRILIIVLRKENRFSKTSKKE